MLFLLCNRDIAGCPGPGGGSGAGLQAFGRRWWDRKAARTSRRQKSRKLCARISVTPASAWSSHGLGCGCRCSQNASSGHWVLTIDHQILNNLPRSPHLPPLSPSSIFLEYFHFVHSHLWAFPLAVPASWGVHPPDMPGSPLDLLKSLLQYHLWVRLSQARTPRHAPCLIFSPYIRFLHSQHLEQFPQELLNTYLFVG